MPYELSVRSNPLTDLASHRLTRASAWLRIPGIVLGGSVLMAVCARLALPLFFTPVPLTLAPFAVLLLGLLLTPRLKVHSCHLTPADQNLLRLWIAEHPTRPPYRERTTERRGESPNN